MADEFVGDTPRRLSSGLADAVPGLVAFASVAVLAAANGGYDPPSWGVGSALLLTLAAMTMLARPAVGFSRTEVAMGAGLLGFTGWTLVSVLWSGNAAVGVLSAERLLVYVAGLAAVLVVARPGRATVGVLAGALAAATVTVANGLAGVILPTLLAGNGQAQTGRLAAPVGYWNGLAMVAVIGILLSLGMAARSSGAIGRVTWLLPLPVLAVGLYLTYSRGGWVALGVGLVILLALETRRWQVALVAAACAPGLVLDILVTAGSPALTHTGSPVGPATIQGHRLGLVIAATLPMIAGAGLAALALERRWVPSQLATRAARGLVALATVAAVAVPLITYGSPAAVVRHVYSGFGAGAPGGFRAHHGRVGRSLNDRLFNLSGDGRIELWSAAWHDFTAHPVLGSGAGTYQSWWLRHRPGTLKVVNAHNLYLETLAELGPVGLILLLVALGTPLVVAVRSRGTPMVAVAGAAFAAFCVHAAVDWDFQLTGVTLLGLVCAASVLVQARPQTLPRWRRGRRCLVIAGAVLLIVAAVAGLRGNLALSRSQAAARTGAWASAASQARLAHSWQPWSDQPYLALGEAELGAGHYAAAAFAFRSAARLSPGDWNAWFGLARATTGGTRAAAIARALALDPHSRTVGFLARSSGVGSGT